MNNKITVFLTACGIAILTACGNSDPVAQLEKLKAQRAELDAQITELEAQVNAGQPVEVKSKEVLVTTIATQEFKHYIDVQGVVDAESQAAIQPQMPGVITKIYVNEGQNVSKGQILGEVDNSVMTAQLNAIQPQLTMAMDVFNRQKRLWDQKIGSEIQFLQAKTTKEALEKQIAAIQEQINLTKLTAPISGIIDHIGAKIGQYSAPGMPDPAFRIINNSKMKVKAEFAEGYASTVENGDETELYFPDINERISGKTSYVAKFINPLTRTFTVESAIQGEGSKYRPNMVAVLKVVDYKNPTAVVLPINSLLSSGNETYVYVVAKENNKEVAKKRIITSGKTYDGWAEITSGLQAGDRVVTTGQFEIVEGSAVNIK
jgi:membrane fusion protein (multidrug efflux system)